MAKEEKAKEETKEESKTDYKEAVSGDVIKLENAGDSVEGIFQNIEESKMYSGSYAVSIQDKEELKTVFVSNIVKDLIDKNSIKIGQQIKIEFVGKKETQDGSKEYNDYKVYFK